jgi:hypothetical protein
MIVWQGAGILGGIIPILFHLLTGMAVRAMTGDDYLKTHSWPGALRDTDRRGGGLGPR